MSDIGDVDDVSDVVTLPFEYASQRVGEDVGAQIPDVLVGVDRRATRVDAGVSRLERLEQLQSSAERVEQAQPRVADFRLTTREPG